MKDDLIGLGSLLGLFALGGFIGPWLGEALYRLAILAAAF